ncbi:MAG: tetratricopeptide repeat protein, partial [Myxococcota bacterium]
MVAASTTDRWVYGPAWDLLVGCGLWYVLALIVFSFAGEGIRSGGAMVVLPFAVLVFGTPHYGATLLRVYERREDRRGYALFAVHASIALALAFAAGVHIAWVGSLIVTVYITWSPWHYSGQNYGLAVMFLRRRGVGLDKITKRWLYASFTLSYALTFLALHSGGQAGHFAPISVDRVNYQFMRIGFPSEISNIALGAVALAYALALVVSGARLARRGSLRDLVPTAALALVQASWFSIPLLLRNFAVGTSIEPLESSYGSYYFLWIAIGHSIQYLWITSYYAHGETDWTGQSRYFAKAMLAGAAIWTVPTLIFAPGLLGRLPYDGGFAVLAASIVNIHHFVLDGAIWKLRDGRVARMLLRNRSVASEAGAAPVRRRRWGRRFVWAIGGLSFAIMFFSKWQSDVVIRAAWGRGDTAQITRAANELAWVGRDSAKIRRRLGDELEGRNNLEGALRQYHRANAIRPTVSTWFKIAKLHEGEKLWSEAIEAYDAALLINPDEENVLYQMGLARLE